MKLRFVWEHNGDDTLLYAQELPGAYARGASLQEALAKLPADAAAWLRWAGETPPDTLEPELAQEKHCALTVRDADSDVLFDSERLPLPPAEYERLRALAMRSARDFLALYEAVPDKHTSPFPARSTFYGPVPRTAEEMYQHTKNVNDYYFGEIGVETDHAGTIVQCRARGFALLEQQPDFLRRPAVLGSYEEEWSLRKVLRRFLWHDRIHAKALYRMAVAAFGPSAVPDPFGFAAVLQPPRG